MAECGIESIAKESEQAEDQDVHEQPAKKCKQELKGVHFKIKNTLGLNIGCKYFRKVALQQYWF